VRDITSFKRYYSGEVRYGGKDFGWSSSHLRRNIAEENAIFGHPPRPARKREMNRNRGRK
jgi:hypothetical protein